MNHHSTTSPHSSGVHSVEPGKYSAGMIQHLLDRAVYFHLYCLQARQSGGDVAIRKAERTIGFRLCHGLNRFEVSLQRPTQGAGLRAFNTVGEQLGRCDSRWLLCPDDFYALPGVEPPATPLDWGRQQRFVMLDMVCEFGPGRDGFRGFGTGSTFPSPGGTLLAAAVGNVMEGRGRLSGLEGTYVYCGSLKESEGFRGSLMLRVLDPQGVFQTGCQVPWSDDFGWPEPDVTYLVFRGQATETDKVVPILDANGQLEGLNVAQGLRLFRTDAATHGRDGLCSTSQVGNPIGEIDAQIIYDPTAPGGGPLDPIPYTAFDEYKFTDSRGQSIGRFFIDEGEGRTFNLQLAEAPGQQAIRFGGFGPILRGSGSLEGATGLMTDNSVVSFTPHVSASVYVIRVDDARGKYRARGGDR
jgi:hypothetical protein